MFLCSICCHASFFFFIVSVQSLWNKSQFLVSFFSNFIICTAWLLFFQTSSSYTPYPTSHHLYKRYHICMLNYRDTFGQHLYFNLIYLKLYFYLIWSVWLVSLQVLSTCWVRLFYEKTMFFTSIVPIFKSTSMFPLLLFFLYSEYYLSSCLWYLSFQTLAL